MAEVQPQGLQDALTYSKGRDQKRPQPPPREGDKGQPPHKGRTIILCFDGTSNEYNGTNTNVVRLFSCFEKHHPKQLVYYQTGIGTAIKTRFMSISRIFNVIDQGIAFNLGDHICDAYRFLQQHWREGDKICIFGFSRGAYTARALAGMLQIVGLLYSPVPEQVEFAYKLYIDLGRSADASKHPRHEFSRPVTIDFLGVWDTVSSVGVLFPQSLPFSRSSKTIKVFRQALALDERRVKFIPSPWTLSVEEQTELGRNNWIITRSAKDFAAPNSSTFRNVLHWFFGVLELLLNILVILFPPLLGGIYLFNQLFTRPKITKPKTRLIPAQCLKKEPPDVKEFAMLRVASDIGGGNTKDLAKDPDSSKLLYVPTLSTITLRWMIRELYEADQQYNLCIRWFPVQLARFGIYLPTDSPLTNDHDHCDCYNHRSHDGDPKFIPTLPSANPPMRVHHEVTPWVTQRLGDDPRRAEFKDCLKYDSGVLIDLKYHEADVKSAIANEFKTWDRIYKGVKEWKGFPNPKQFLEWVSASLVTLLLMMLWWALEHWPYVRMTRRETNHIWRSRFKMKFNFFSSREIPSPATMVDHPELEVPEDARPGWKSFIDNRKTMLVHHSVVKRKKIKGLGYHPRPWRTGDIPPNEDIPTNWKLTY
ncbi:uncharacterized protein EI90DRAFT_3124035 [Cantharellus anzutake]|uniref:uncharacterized protein n=1 Tax=Cantharellus anzutake TaxID=1750568 RepID=UPI0019050934|nr:uncharacterized protein EI90DRAFT_3124035 [Cantharellus anzutake]KAF8330821.1 hypothetical protein EI90DRAFT_3124035 [Cantharellus anzutake]